MQNSSADPTMERYLRHREKSLKSLTEHVAQINGLPHVNITISDQLKHNCRLSHDGVFITINPDYINNLSMRQWYGAKGSLPLKVADFLTVAFQVGHVYDFMQPDYYYELNRNAEDPNYDMRRFFHAAIDDIAVGIRMKRMPLAFRYFDAFISRLINHVMDNMPYHIQLLNALRLYFLETDPSIVTSWEIKKVLGDPKELSETTARLKQSFSDPKLSFAERRSLADELIYPDYLRLFRFDLMFNRSYHFTQFYGDNSFSFAGEAENPSDKDFKTPQGKQLEERVDALFNLVQTQDIDQMIEDRGEDSGADDPDEGTPSQTLRQSNQPPEDMKLTQADEGAYYEIVTCWSGLIQEVADILVELATPQENIAVPRYRQRFTYEGIRLNPHAGASALLQLETGYARPIWQPIKKVIRHQELHFDGLDIYLLLDTSTSMMGENAEYAAITATCLIEGLLLATHTVEMDALQKSVDVRLQLLTFGSGWAELTPLTREPNPAQKEAVYWNLINPNSHRTMVTGALKKVRSDAIGNPRREVLCLIISDGLFADNMIAFKTAQSMPRNVYIGHINIGQFAGIPITRNYDIVLSPQALPLKLKSILESYFQIHSQR